MCKRRRKISSCLLLLLVLMVTALNNVKAQTNEVQGGIYPNNGQIDLGFVTTSANIPRNHFINLVFAIRYPSTNNVTFTFSSNALGILEQDPSQESFLDNTADYVFDGYRYRTFIMIQDRRLGTTASTIGNWPVNTPIPFLTFTVSGVDPGDLELVQDNFAMSKGGEWFFETSDASFNFIERTNTDVPYIQEKLPRTPITLPVELISLTAKQTQNGTMLKWATASESDNKGFEVLRRMENEAEFKQIGFVSGKGNTTSITDYKFEDKQNVYQTAYYRLRQVDFDLTANYSQIVAVTGKGGKLTNFSLYPNPAKDILQIQTDIQIENLSVAMYSAEGRLVMSKEIKNGEQFSVAHLPQGLYQLLYTTETGEKGAGKIIIQK